MFNDSIADMLTRIRNAATARRTDVVMPYSKMRESIAVILKKHGYLVDFKVATNGAFKALEVTLPTDPEIITALVRVSKPGRRVYVAKTEIPSVLGGRGLVILSTSSGVMTGREARKQGLGGELICKVW